MLAASVAGLIVLPWVPVPAGLLPDPAYLPALLWPVLLGIALAVFAAARLQAWSLPAGDVLVPLLQLGRLGTAQATRLLDGIRQGLERRRPQAEQAAGAHPAALSPPRGSRLELAMRRHAALLFVLLLAASLLVVVVLSGAAP